MCKIKYLLKSKSIFIFLYKFLLDRRIALNAAKSYVSPLQMRSYMTRL